MQQLTVITAFSNCIDQRVEMPGTRSTGHCQYMYTQVPTTPLQPASTLGEPAGHSLCLTIEQRTHKAYSKMCGGEHRQKGYLEKLIFL